MATSATTCWWSPKAIPSLGEIYDGGDVGTDILRYAGTSEVDFSGSTIFAIERLADHHLGQRSA